MLSNARSPPLVLLLVLANASSAATAKMLAALKSGSRRERQVQMDVVLPGVSGAGEDETVSEPAWNRGLVCTAGQRLTALLASTCMSGIGRCMAAAC